MNVSRLAFVVQMPLVQILSVVIIAFVIKDSRRMELTALVCLFSIYFMFW